MKFPGNREMVVSRELWWPNKELLMWNTECGPHKIQISLTQKSQQIQPETHKIILSETFVCPFHFSPHDEATHIQIKSSSLDAFTKTT